MTIATDLSRLSQPAHVEGTGAKGVRRIAFIDNARAIGIVLVVLGHAPGLPALAVDLIFAFHMPLFFLLSGLVVGPERLAMTIGARALGLARTLLVPYAAYFVIAYLYWLVFKRHGLRAGEMELLPFWDPLVGFASGIGARLYVDVVLWFFPCLFLAAMGHHVVRKRLSASGTAWATLALAVVFVGLRSGDAARWPWSADCAMVGVAFYSIGAALNHLLRHGDAPRDSARLLVAGLTAAGGCLALTAVNGRVDLNELSFGRHASLYFPMAACGIVATLSVAVILPQTRLAQWLSVNTLVIFPLHFLMFSVFTGVAVVGFHLDPVFKELVWTGLIYTVLALLSSRPVAAFIDAMAPWLIRGSAARHLAPIARR